MGEMSLVHWLIVIAIFLIFFGPQKLPQLGQSLGKAIRGFKEAMNEIEVDPKDIKDHDKLAGDASNKNEAQKESEKTKS